MKLFEHFVHRPGLSVTAIDGFEAMWPFKVNKGHEFKLQVFERTRVFLLKSLREVYPGFDGLQKVSPQNYVWFAGEAQGLTLTRHGPVRMTYGQVYWKHIPVP